MDRDPFKEYIRQVEPNKRDKGYAWSTAIGLQAVDGLKPSDYLLETAVKNISVEKDGKATVKLPKTDKPITKVEIEGTTSYGKKFTNFFSGCISNKSCIVVYLTETMDLGVTANIE